MSAYYGQGVAISTVPGCSHSCSRPPRETHVMVMPISQMRRASYREVSHLSRATRPVGGGDSVRSRPSGARLHACAPSSRPPLHSAPVGGMGAAASTATPGSAGRVQGAGTVLRRGRFVLHFGNPGAAFSLCDQLNCLSGSGRRASAGGFRHSRAACGGPQPAGGLQLSGSAVDTVDAQLYSGSVDLNREH